MTDNRKDALILLFCAACVLIAIDRGPDSLLGAADLVVLVGGAIAALLLVRDAICWIGKHLR